MVEKENKKEPNRPFAYGGKNAAMEIVSTYGNENCSSLEKV